MKQNLLLGAIIGDTIGSIYEFNPTKNYHFRLLDERMDYTDDSVMTIAVAHWLLCDAACDCTPDRLVVHMQKWGRKYPHPMGSYGGMFSQWLCNNNPKPYNSWGNGSAMRVSPVGFCFQTLDDTLKVARISAEVTHNHPEGIKGAQATAAAIFLARTGKSKEEIRTYISHTFGYDLNRTCNDIRPTYHFEASCQETVPQAILAFLDSKDFEDAIRLTVSLGGDADTMGAITGAIAAAFYKEIPDLIYNFVWNKLPKDMKEVLDAFSERNVAIDEKKTAMRSPERTSSHSMNGLNDAVKLALKLSMEAHAGQKDKAGEAYFLHPVTVAMTLAKNGYSDDCIATALLHDVVEDTHYTLDDLSAMGFSEQIITALSLLTHKKDVPYMSYVKAAKSNSIARAVKMADLLHNMDISRLEEITDLDKQRLEKYQKAFELLEQD